MKLVKVNNNSNLVKDEETGAVLNNNVEDVEKAKEIKEKRIEKEEELIQLKNDVSDLKDMMKQLLEKMNNDG